MNVCIGDDCPPDEGDNRPQDKGTGKEGAEQNKPQESPVDPFDPANLRLSQDFAAGMGINKPLLTVPMRKPSKEWWVRVHPIGNYRLQTAVLELKEDRETYLVAQHLWAELAAEATFSPRAIFTAMNRQGVVFLWPVRLPGPDGKVDAWSASAMEAANMATTGWVRTAANMDLGAYDVWTTEAQIPDPIWPAATFRDLLATAFKGRLIEDLDHPVLRRLRGEE